MVHTAGIYILFTYILFTYILFTCILFTCILFTYIPIYILIYLHTYLPTYIPFIHTLLYAWCTQQVYSGNVMICIVRTVLTAFLYIIYTIHIHTLPSYCTALFLFFTVSQSVYCLSTSHPLILKTSLITQKSFLTYYLMLPIFSFSSSFSAHVSYG